MPILAGQIVKAGQLNRMQPRLHRVAATGPLNGPATNADVPGATLTLITETAGATVVIDAWFDYRVTSTAGTALGSGNVSIDGAIQPEYAILRDSHAASGASFATSTGHTYRAVLSTAGTHIIKLVASPSAGQQVNVYSSLTVTVYEVV